MDINDTLCSQDFNSIFKEHYYFGVDKGHQWNHKIITDKYRILIDEYMSDFKVFHITIYKNCSDDVVCYTHAKSKEEALMCIDDYVNKPSWIKSKFKKMINFFKSIKLWAKKPK